MVRKENQEVALVELSHSFSHSQWALSFRLQPQEMGPGQQKYQKTIKLEELEWQSSKIWGIEEL